MNAGKGFEKETCGSFCVSRRTEEEIERVSFRINGSIEREIHCFLTLMYVSSTRQESFVTLR